MPLTTIILDMFSFYYYQQQPPFWLFCFCLLNWGWEYGGWLYIKDFPSDTTNYYKIRFDYQSSAESSLAWLLPGEKPFLGLLKIGASLGQPACPERPIVDAESIQTKSGFWTELQRETHLVVIASQAWTNLEIFTKIRKLQLFKVFTAMVLRKRGCLYNLRLQLWCLSKENWLPSKDLLDVVKSRKSLKRNPTSSFSDLVFFRRPQCRNLLGPTELVRELKVIFSWSAFSSVCKSTWIWSHSNRSEFSFIRIPSFTFKKEKGSTDKVSNN